MSNLQDTAYSEIVKDLMGKKSYLLTKAQTLSEVGMNETAQPLYLSAAAYEERIAALMDLQNEELDAAVHRISAASCFEKAGDLSRAVNHYRAALSGPLLDPTREEVLTMLGECLQLLAQKPLPYFTAAPHSEAMAA